MKELNISEGNERFAFTVVEGGDGREKEAEMSEVGRWCWSVSNC